MNPSRRPPWVAVLPGLVLAVALTAWRFDAKPMWRDEYYTYGTANTTLEGLVSIVRGPDIGLVGYYTAMHAWMLGGDSTAWMRLPGALATVALVALTAVLGRRTGGTAAGAVAGVLVAVVPAVVTHAQEARAYPFVLLGCTGLALVLLRDLEAPSPRRRALVALVAVVPVVLHPLVGIPAVVGLFAAALLRPGAERRVVLVALGAPSGICAGLLVAAGLLLQGDVDPGAVTGLAGITAFSRNVAEAAVVAAAVLAAAVAGALALARTGGPWVVLAGWCAVPVLVIGALGLTGSYFQHRYVAAAVPAVAVLAGCGIAAVAGAVRGRVPATAALVLAAAVVVGALAVDAVRFRAEPFAVEDPEAAAEVIAEEHRAGDAVVYSGRVTRGLVGYYLPEAVEAELDDPLLLVPPEESGTLRGTTVPPEDRARALAGFDRVWVVGREVRGEFADRGEVAEARSGRRLAERHEFGDLTCELWVA